MGRGVRGFHRASPRSPPGRARQRWQRGGRHALGALGRLEPGPRRRRGGGGPAPARRRPPRPLPSLGLPGPAEQQELPPGKGWLLLRKHTGLGQNSRCDALHRVAAGGVGGGVCVPPRGHGCLISSLKHSPLLARPPACTTASLAAGHGIISGTRESACSTLSESISFLNFRGSTWSLGLSNSVFPLIRKNIL